MPLQPKYKPMSKDFQVLVSSESNEWYTPPEIIEKARRVMGGIELDPASCEIAQTWIKADRYFSQDWNGFNEDWIAKTLWLNPPYGKRSKSSNIYGSGAWLEKLHEEHLCGNVDQAIALARGDSQALFELASTYPMILCRRIAFINARGEVSKNPPPGTMIFGLGVDKDKFFYEFSDMGVPLISPIKFAFQGDTIEPSSLLSAAL